MIVIYYPHSKHTHNLKVMEFESFKNSKNFSNFQKTITTCKWGEMCMTYETKL
jgi:hypothetical protein